METRETSIGRDPFAELVGYEVEVAFDVVGDLVELFARLSRVSDMEVGLAKQYSQCQTNAARPSSFRTLWRGVVIGIGGLIRQLMR